MKTTFDLEEREQRINKAGNAVKWGFVILLAALAGIIAFFQLFRTPSAQRTLEEAVRKLEEGDLEGAMALVDPQGQLGILWNENVGMARDRLLDFFSRYRLEFSSLSWKTRTEGDFAESIPVKGRVIVYPREKEGPPLAVYQFGGDDLVFYLQKKGGVWLIEGVNYDLEELLSGGLGVP